MAVQLEYEFKLPKGYVDKDGNSHQKGIMRLATAADEILPMRDPRVQQNPSYLTVVLLSRVITKLGEVKTIDTSVIESLFTTDYNYLQDFYSIINNDAGCFTCPNCGKGINLRPMNE